jgi:hypothetical protein
MFLGILIALFFHGFGPIHCAVKICGMTAQAVGGGSGNGN